MPPPPDRLAAAIPEPPFPAPARKQAAIEEALRRFDGGAARPEAAAAGRAGPGGGWWRGQGRSWAPALATAVLALLIALPVAWTFLGDPSVDGGPRARPPAIAKGQDSAPALAQADEALSGEREAAAGTEAKAAGSTVGAGEKGADRSAGETQLAQLDLRGPGPTAPSAPPAPPPPPAARSDEKASADARTEEQYAAAASPVLVTGSRIARPNPAAAAAEPESDDGDIVLTATRSSRPGRGDWNACTVDDPRRSLSGCRHLVDPKARGAAGKAGVSLAEGLSSAWQGDYPEAIAAFDRAIAATPRSAFAWLNRGLAWKREGDLDRALADLDSAIRLAPRTARLYYQRAQILRQRGNEKRARADERRAVNLDPDYGAVVD